MVNPLDPVLSHHISQERQSEAVPELPNNQPHQSPKRSHAKDRTENIAILQPTALCQHGAPEVANYASATLCACRQFWHRAELWSDYSK